MCVQDRMALYLHCLHSNILQVKALGNMIGKETYTEVTAELLQSWHIPLLDQEQRQHH